jgi:hypothetical protein
MRLSGHMESYAGCMMHLSCRLMAACCTMIPHATLCLRYVVYSSKHLCYPLSNWFPCSSLQQPGCLFACRSSLQPPLADLFVVKPAKSLHCVLQELLRVRHSLITWGGQSSRMSEGVFCMRHSMARVSGSSSEYRNLSGPATPACGWNLLQYWRNINMLTSRPCRQSAPPSTDLNHAP